MKFNEWLLIWLALGVYCVIAAIGGSHVCAALTLLCGFMAGRAVKTRLEPKVHPNQTL